jgi:RNA polymerase sigma factor (sigma-70 family)
LSFSAFWALQLISGPGLPSAFVSITIHPRSLLTREKTLAQMSRQAKTAPVTDPQSGTDQHQHSTDEALLRACRTGDAAAWESLLDRYERLVYSIARNTGLSPEDAADITQLTFGYLLQSLDGMTDEGNLRAWLATVAKRHSRRLLVRQLRYQSAELDEEIVGGLMPDRANLNGIERWELAEWLRSGLERIDERCRHLLRALYFDPSEPSYADIASSVGIAEGSVGPIRARCLKRLREMLTDDSGNS